jgi:hypothetical protein
MQNQEHQYGTNVLIGQKPSLEYIKHFEISRLLKTLDFVAFVSFPKLLVVD